MNDEVRYGFLTTIEELFGVALSNQDAVTASSTLGLAKAILKAKSITSHSIEYAKAFVLLRQKTAEVFCIPQRSLTPSTLWDGLFPAESPRSCRQSWRRLQEKLNVGLPRLQGPRWPWIVFDVFFVPIAILCYVGFGQSVNAFVFSLTLLAVSGLSALGIVRCSANRAPHKTIGDSAGYLAEMKAEGAGTTSEDWMVREMDLIVHGIVEAELEGQYSGPQIPFEQLRK